VAADLGYDDYKLYNLSIDRGFELVYRINSQSREDKCSGDR